MPAFEMVLFAPDKVDFIRRAKLAGCFARLFWLHFVPSGCEQLEITWLIEKII